VSPSLPRRSCSRFRIWAWIETSSADEAGPDGEGAGDADALALPAAELVRVAARCLGRQPDQLEQLRDPRGSCGPAAETVDGEPFADDARHAHAGIEGAIRVLEDDLHLATERAQLARRETQEGAPPEQHVARRRLDEPQHDAAERRLAAPRLPHQTERLARLDGERDAVDRPHPCPRPREDTPAHRVVLVDVAHLDERAHTRMQAAR
jgi:hypothetical protein